ncbi:precorrin-6Y C5,15-methyltransferase (decarboxylating) subunit CbiT [Methanobacterium sp.]|uniref:precorrin-6Y C5,15-methyltransferase (decarboxylating) subunit CbiT n=1 Tax=Methanobacterium sp. TaxID=2164 RepID=UPI003C75ED66
MIPDDDFITHENVPGPTKEEIRCIVMCKSNVSQNDIVVDIGCGTGGLTLEFAKRSRLVYAVDRSIDALNTTEKNLKKHNLDKKVQLIHDDALKALKNIETIDILMIGGSGGDLPLLIEEGYKKLVQNGKIIVTSILLETPVEAVETMKELNMDIDVVDISISKGLIMKRGTMMIARNPITIVTGKK